MKPLNIVLPVMLHEEEEIIAFKQAQERLKVLGDKYGIPIEASAFLLYLPARSRTPENLAKQIENQTRQHPPLNKKKIHWTEGPRKNRFNPLGKY